MSEGPSALDALIEGLDKKAFQAAPPGAAVPPGAPPSAVMPPPPGAMPPQGGPPMDPSMMPPGAPMDPSMMPPGAPMDPSMMPPGGAPPAPTMDPQVVQMMDQQAMLIAQNQETMEVMTQGIEQLQAENDQLMQNQQQQQQEIMTLRAELEAFKSSLDSAMTMPGV